MGQIGKHHGSALAPGPAGLPVRGAGGRLAPHKNPALIRCRARPEGGFGSGRRGYSASQARVPLPEWTTAACCRSPKQVE